MYFALTLPLNIALSSGRFALNIKAAKLFKKHGYLADSKIAFGCNLGYYLNKNRVKEAKEAIDAYQSTHYRGNSNWEDSYAYVLYEQGLYYLIVLNSATL